MWMPCFYQILTYVAIKKELNTMPNINIKSTNIWPKEQLTCLKDGFLNWLGDFHNSYVVTIYNSYVVTIYINTGVLSLLKFLLVRLKCSIRHQERSKVQMHVNCKSSVCSLCSLHIFYFPSCFPGHLLLTMMVISHLRGPWQLFHIFQLLLSWFS